MTKDEALDLALEALATEEYRLRQIGQSQVYPGIGFAITAIKQARSAPVQEPVAWPIDEDVAKRIAEKQFVSYEVVQLIARAILATPPAAQRQWVGLTDERRKAIYDECQGLDVMKAISQTEAKLKEKNNG